MTIRDLKKVLSPDQLVRFSDWSVVKVENRFSKNSFPLDSVCEKVLDVPLYHVYTLITDGALVFCFN